MAKKNISIQFDDVIKALLDNNRPFSPIFLHKLSGLEGPRLAKLQKTWSDVKVERRISVIEDLEELSEADPLLNFDQIGLLGLNDKDMRVRAGAIRLLWEYEDKKLIPTLIKMFRTDESELVRATAASGLGKFIYLGDLEEIPEKTFENLIENLVEVLDSDEKPLVRRRALEALSFHNREDIISHLQKAYDSNNNEWISSALFGMGRSANERWEKLVLQQLDSEDSENRFEAVRAAGELELKTARAPLLAILEEEDLDDDLLHAAIWSLSKIGGEGVGDALQNLLESTDDDDEADFISSALDNLEFTESLSLPNLLSAQDDSEDDFYQIIDLTKEDNDEDNNEEQEPPTKRPRKRK